tara:strand:+ start:890 stop:1453 length:564 start_codon:yes stop_codon:yes gene_type:complete
MNKITTIATLVAAATAMTASADDLVQIDLSVANQITIVATDGLASADASFSSFTGVLLADFFNTAGAGGPITGGTGDFSTFGEASDGSPSMFNDTASFGLNFWSFTNDAPSIVSGEQAFSGSATFVVDAGVYAAMLAGNSSGDLIAGSDRDSNIAGGVNVGTWSLVPAPSSVAMLGLGGLVAGRRRR